MEKKSVLSFLFILLIAGTAFSQTYVTQVKPVGNKKWGYANLKGEVIIEPQLKSVMSSQVGAWHRYTIQKTDSTISSTLKEKNWRRRSKILN